MKKTLTLIIAVITAFSLLASTLTFNIQAEASAPVPSRNDPSGDGILNIYDVMLVLKNAIDGIYTGECDINGDKKVSLLDVLNIIKLLSTSTSDIIMSEEELYDKVLGSWIGQMVGVSWAASTEFHYRGEIIPEEEFPSWTPNMINDAFKQDDVYVEVPFLEAMVENGVNCDGKYLAEKLRDSEFQLWHANLQARENLKNGIEFPMSGHYNYNSHADDIDWQIESDFLGMMYPGLVNEAASRAFELGHITNYGDGVYGGVFVSAMHSAAFTADSIDEIIKAGLAVIPDGTTFKELMNDIITCYENGNIWQETWQMLETKWTYTDRCVECSGAINIDAKLNAGYVLIGLLYGNGDFAETIKISTQCGQDSDCNPSSAASILGNYYGASGLPEIYTEALNYDSIKFDYTDYTFNEVVEINFSLLKQLLTGKGYTCTASGNWTITPDSQYTAVPFEQWEETVLAELEITHFNEMAIRINLRTADITSVSALTFDMGDGFVTSNNIAYYTYENPGTYTIKCTITGENGDINTIQQEVIIEDSETTTDTLRVPATAFCSVDKPTGSGNKNIGIIYDGFIDQVGSLSTSTQYDTYNGGKELDLLYAGLEFACSAKINGVSFTEGRHFIDGGWFETAPNIEVLVKGVWTVVSTAISPTYPESNYTAHGKSFETYTFTFDSPVVCDGIRLAGTPGGKAYFVSICEITPTVLEIYNNSNPIIISSVATPTGSGSRDLSVICDNIVPEASSATPSMQFDTYNGKTENAETYIGYLFRAERDVKELVFSEGGHYNNGGWWKDGQIYAEVLIDGVWVRPDCTITPSYPNGNETSLFGKGYETYKFTFSETVKCDGVRLYGVAGGSAGFISVSELVVK